VLTRFSAVLGLAAILCGQALGAQKWVLQYFYDEVQASLVINDLAFPDAKHGVAVGYIDEKGKSKPVSVMTNDGGAHWTVSSLHEIPVSLFFLNDSVGWMVTPKGIYQTNEGGRNWRELPKSPKLLVRVCFLDENRGFAVGTHKSAYQTQDGGKHWEPIPVAAEPQTNPEYTVYNTIAFVNARAGLISGYSAPPRSDDPNKPDWLDPKSATQRREWPHLSIMLDTRDGGQTWTSSTASIFGRISRVSFLPDGKGLGLLEFTASFTWPSEVIRLNGLTGDSSSAYKAKDREITDVLVQPSGAYLAGVEVVGRMQHSPIPAKLKVLTSSDLTDWHEMDVDYRAEASRALIRASSDGTLWVATDTGMILKLVE
jgi:photosystem II stability/assembly factor-like uncharacterized protein